MLYLRFLAGAGGVLLLLLFAANVIVPQPVTPQAGETKAGETQSFNHATIRITATRKGPERVVIDTTLPTVPAPAAIAAANAAIPVAPQSQGSAPVREALAQVPADAAAIKTAAKSTTVPAHKTTHHRMAQQQRRPYDPRQMQPQQPRMFAGLFFSPFGWR